MPLYRIRPFEPSDGDAVRAIVTTVLESLGLAMDSGGVDADLADVQRAYVGGCFLVVEETESNHRRVVGCGGIRPEGEGVFELRKMYFVPEIRGRGLGKKLLTALLDVSRKKGARSIRLETNKKMDRAIALYASAGFRVQEGAKPIPPRCDVVMELDVEGAREA